MSASGIHVDSNDQWSFYQAKRSRDYQLQLNLDLLNALGRSDVQSQRLYASYADKHNHYQTELETIKKKAEGIAQKTGHAQQQAAHYDFSEAILEIALVLTTLYFISQRRMFPLFGSILGVIGTLIWVIALLV